MAEDCERALASPPKPATAEQEKRGATLNHRLGRRVCTLPKGHEEKRHEMPTGGVTSWVGDDRDPPKPTEPQPERPGRHEFKPCDHLCANRGCHYTPWHTEPCGKPESDPVHILAVEKHTFKRDTRTINPGPLCR